MRVLVFGASITQGFWDTEGGWVARVRKHYDELFIKDFSKLQPAVFNLGVSADTSTDVLNRFDADAKSRGLKDKIGAVIFAIGTNNALQEGDKFWSTPEQYESELEQLVAKARNYASKIMFVGLTPCDEKRTMPVAWGDYTYTNERIWLMDQTMRKIAAKNSVPHVPMFETFQDRQTELDLYADGLHPNNAGHEIIADLVLPELEKLLKS